MKHQNIGKSRLHDATLGALRAYIKRSETKAAALATVAKATGLGVYWLDVYARGKAGSPSVHRVETLYRHLTGKQIDV